VAPITWRRGPGGHLGPCPQAPFAVDTFLAQPLVARLATHGLALQPVWYLWEDEKFWVITGPWSALERRLTADSAFTLVVDTCDPGTGRVRQVLARGHGTVTAFDAARGRRKLSRYLGPDEEHWDTRFRPAGSAATANRWACLAPDSLRIADLSFRPAPGAPSPAPLGRPTPLP